MDDSILASAVIDTLKIKKFIVACSFANRRIPSCVEFEVEQVALEFYCAFVEFFVFNCPAFLTRSIQLEAVSSVLRSLDNNLYIMFLNFEHHFFHNGKFRNIIFEA